MLSDPKLAWPVLLQLELPAVIDEPVEIVHHKLSAVRPEALSLLEKWLGESQPNVVTLGVNPYAFAISSVYQKVRHRFGQKAADRYMRVEQKFDRWTGDTFVNAIGRRFVRKTVGVATYSTYDQVMQAYTAFMRRLAREEDLQVVVMAGARLSNRLHLLDDTMVNMIDQFREEVRQLTEDHRFVFFDTESTVEGPDRESYFQDDGVHRNPSGHRRIADMVLPVIATAATPSLTH